MSWDDIIEELAARLTQMIEDWPRRDEVDQEIVFIGKAARAWLLTQRPPGEDSESALAGLEISLS